MLNNVQPAIERTRGKMLVSMPHLADPRFYHSTLAMYKHDDEGAGGIRFNLSLIHICRCRRRL